MSGWLVFVVIYVCCALALAPILWKPALKIARVLGEFYAAFWRDVSPKQRRLRRIRQLERDLNL